MIPGFTARIDRWLERLATRLLSRAADPLPVLDLHGLGVKDALGATERFLHEATGAGVAEVRIVYGKGRHSPGGRGVLREVIPRWLAHEGSRWVVSATPEPDARGEDSAIRVRLAVQHDPSRLTARGVDDQKNRG